MGRQGGDLEAREFDADGPWCVTLLIMTMICALVMLPMVIMNLNRGSPSISVHLTGYDGIDPGGAARVVSPAFNVTLRLNDTCVDRADVAVMYSGVALGWARVDPRDCVKRRWAKDVEVVARGAGVGLSQRLRDRMASDRRSAGTMELDIDVTTYKEDPPSTETEYPQHMIVQKVRIANEKEQLARTDTFEFVVWSA